MSRMRNSGTMNHNFIEDSPGEVSASSNSQQDDSDDEDIEADGYEDEDEVDVVVPTVASNIKRKRGRQTGLPKGRPKVIMTQNRTLKYVFPLKCYYEIVRIEIKPKL